MLDNLLGGVYTYIWIGSLRPLIAQDFHKKVTKLIRWRGANKEGFLFFFFWGEPSENISQQWISGEKKIEMEMEMEGGTP